MSSSRHLISTTLAWKNLTKHADEEMNQTHLRTLLQDSQRAAALVAEYDGVFLDFSRQRVTNKTMNLLFDLAETANLFGHIRDVRDGVHVNVTENRAAGHMALRAAANQVYKIDGENVVPAVHKVLQKIHEFSDKVRSGAWKGATGQNITNIIAIGIGGSYLGANFVYESLQHDHESHTASKGRQLRFLANVDPVAFSRAVEGLKPENTMAIVISKTFTTKETMLNARTVRKWFTDALGATSVSKHMVAVSTNIPAVTSFGIDANNAFEFWDWVGGRYSVSSAVGVLPLALQFGYPVVEKFLAGARSIDTNFLTASPRENLSVLLGLLGIWNNNFLHYSTRALIPYGEALNKLAPHIQQVDMESNGKRVTTTGHVVDFATGEVNFGEPGTNAQHSFFQLIHQGQVVPVDFIGFVESQTPIELKGDEVSNHDELMSNFFAQPDALAMGKTEAELKAEGVAPELFPHREFPGNRPSSSLLLPRLTAYETGQLLALYEHRTVVQGFIWGINSFDQFGVELGKKLADQVRGQLKNSRTSKDAPIQGFVPSTSTLLQRYLKAQSKL